MNSDDLYGLLIYSTQWLLPVAMIFLYNYKTIKLNKYYVFSYMLLLSGICAYTIFMFIQKSEPYIFYLFSRYPTLYLICFYGLIGLTFTNYLIIFKNWNFPQAFSISVICCSIGSFFWEVPTIIYNLLTVGYEIDIFLQLFAVLFFIFIYTSCGWKNDKKTILIALSGFVISTIFLYFRSPMPIEYKMFREYLYWNSPYFMINRFINTVIVLYCVNKTKPMEKSK